jgi:hypothetical protein
MIERHEQPALPRGWLLAAARIRLEDTDTEIRFGMLVRPEIRSTALPCRGERGRNGIRESGHCLCDRAAEAVALALK